jgi:hypothetical protein
MDIYLHLFLYTVAKILNRKKFMKKSILYEMYPYFTGINFQSILRHKAGEMLKKIGESTPA